MSNSTVSIVVPVYKVEPWLRDCLNSILAQTFTNWECICVDDGSPDRCGEICDEYAKRDSRFRVIHKTNGGLSSARNAGMDAAKGIYLYFLDSDDILKPETLQILVSSADSENLDTVFFGLEPFADPSFSDAEFTSDEALAARAQRCERPAELCNRILSGSSLFHEIVEKRHFSMTGGIPLRMFRRSSIPPSLRFPEGLVHEDEYFGPLALLSARRVLVISDHLYMRRIREGSIMVGSDQREIHAESYLGIWKLLKRNQSRLRLRGRTKTAYHTFTQQVFRWAISYSKEPGSAWEKISRQWIGWGMKGVLRFWKNAVIGKNKRLAKKVCFFALLQAMRIRPMWWIVYWGLRSIPDSKRIRVWRAMQRHGITTRMPDKGFWICNTLVHTGERYIVKHGIPVGGIYSAINWQRINWKSDIPTKCTDKLAVRDYVRSRIGDEFLIPMHPSEGMFWTRADDINFAALPDRFVLKLNNGSGMNLIVKDKNSLDMAAARKTVATWLASRFSTLHRERQYEGIENKLYCESFLDTPDGNPPDDYKIMCNNGRPLFIWVDTGRNVNHQRSFFDLEFRKLDVRVAHDNIDHEIQKPKNLGKMLEIASRLSAGIPIVRIDLYNVNGKIYFGEMTFTSAACTEKYEPLSFSIDIGNKIDLSPF